MKNTLSILDEIPVGWRLLKGATMAPVGYDMISNGKSLFSSDYQIALIKSTPCIPQKHDPVPHPTAQITATIESKNTKPAKADCLCFSDEPCLPEKLNRLAREQIKLRLLQDIRVDIAVCQLEGWEYKSYLLELQDMIQCFLNKKEEQED